MEFTLSSTFTDEDSNMYTRLEYRNPEHHSRLKSDEILGASIELSGCKLSISPTKNDLEKYAQLIDIIKTARRQVYIGRENYRYSGENVRTPRFELYLSERLDNLNLNILLDEFYYSNFNIALNSSKKIIINIEISDNGGLDEQIRRRSEDIKISTDRYPQIIINLMKCDVSFSRSL